MNTTIINRTVQIDTDAFVLSDVMIVITYQFNPWDIAFSINAKVIQEAVDVNAWEMLLCVTADDIIPNTINREE